MISREEIAARIAQLPPDQQAQAATLALRVYGRCDGNSRDFDKFRPYRFDAAGYIRDVLKWEPWRGSDGQPGQMEVIEAYQLALQQQIEQRDFENGALAAKDLKVWTPGQVIQNRIRVPAGHTVGKTKLSGGIVNHFFDCFPPAIIYTFAPTADQIRLLLWKEIKADRASAKARGFKMPGRVLETELKYSADHFAIGRATSDAGGRGTERAQGQHGEYLLFVLDEAEGIPTFVYNAVESMASGGVAVVLMLANPRTQESDFDAQKDRVNTMTLRISCAWHPNVLSGREIVPGAVKRQYVEGMVETHCEAVSEHEPDQDTFELPFPVRLNDRELPPGTILKPDPEFLFRVLGKAPADRTGNTFVPRGRFEAACKRVPRETTEEERLRVRMGVDASRFGDDFGTLYVNYQARAWRAAQFWKADTQEYAGPIKEHALQIFQDAPDDEKPTSLHIRVDGTGGFGAGVIDALKNDSDLKAAYDDFEVIEVNFASSASDPTKYDDIATEMYAESAESLKSLAVEHAPNALEGDLCKRLFKFVNKSGLTVKKLEPKPDFKKRLKRSPDDGDGFVLAVAPDFIFAHLLPKRLRWA